MRVSENGRYLVDDNGRPFFYLADTAWRLCTAIPRPDVDVYLQHRKEQGFSVIMPVLLVEGGIDNAANCYGDHPLLHNDPAQPNEAYFQQVDYIVNRAVELGFHLAILPTWGEYVGPLKWGIGPTIFTPDNARVYGEYIGRRYGDKPVIWVLGGDRNPETDEVLAVWRAMAAGLRAGDGGRNPITFHPTAVHSSSEWLHDEPWLDFNMMQTGTRIDLDNYNLILRDYNRTPVKPVVDGEARYEHSHRFFSHRPAHGRRVTAHQVRKAAYNAMLSGALGHTYGCRDVWSFYVPDGNPAPRDVDTYWKDALRFPGATHLGLMRRLFEDYPWYKLQPDQSGSVVAVGCGEDGTYTPAAVAQDGTFALIYVPETMPVLVNLAVCGGEPVTAFWFNPRTGSYTFIRRCAGSGQVLFEPPATDSDPDYVLVLESLLHKGGR